LLLDRVFHRKEVKRWKIFINQRLVDRNFHGTGERNLLVDDNPFLLDYLDAFLTMYGYTVVYAPDVANGLTLFEEEPEEF
jgi:ActR/RegA family two-component response regulator